MSLIVTTDSNSIYGYQYNLVEFTSCISHTYMWDNGYKWRNCSVLPTTGKGQPFGLTVRSTCGPGRSKLVMRISMDVSIVISMRVILFRY